MFMLLLITSTIIFACSNDEDLAFPEEDNKVGKYEHKKGLKRPKYKYIDEYGNIQYMDAFNQKRWHPDWKLVSEVEEGGDNND